MSITSYRILDAIYGGDPASGEGARLHAGRWHSEGTSLVYTSEGLHLAICEIAAELYDVKTLGDTHACVEFTFEEAMVEELAEEDYPKDWAATSRSLEARKIGDEWVRSRSSAVLKVPSRHGGYNYLLNPAHPDFSKVRMSAPKRLADLIALD